MNLTIFKYSYSFELRPIYFKLLSIYKAQIFSYLWEKNSFMCGIYVRININGSSVTQDQMEPLDRIAHRGPDGKGIVLKQNVGLAHRRLAIFDLSISGNQPMHYDGLYIVFNGAVYNFIELKTKLINAGYQFDGTSDTEVILKAYHFWMDLAFEKFIGQWALVIYDTKSNTIVASRDRFGIKPLYLCKEQNAIYFGSETKLFHRHRNINTNAVQSFFYNGYSDIEEVSFYTNIREVAPSTILKLNLHDYSSTEHLYYSLDVDHSSNNLSFEESAENLRSLLQDSITMRLRSDVDTGICLSGGMDSNCIANLCYEINPNLKKDCFTIDFDHPNFDEKSFASYTIQKSHYRHLLVVPTFDDMMDILDEVVYFQDFPFGSMSIIAQFILYKAIKKQGIKVTLSGQGADEILCGYDAHIRQYAIHLSKKNKLEFSKYLLTKTIHQPTLFWKKIASKPTTFDSNRREEFASFKQFIYHTITKSPLPSLLRYEDRNAMASGIESRLPFLDHRIVDFCLSLPVEYLMSNHQRKPLLQEAMKGIVPKPILKRKDKLAFSTPTAIWMKQYASSFNALAVQATSEMDKLGFNIQNSSTLDIGSKWRLISLGLWLKKINA